ncbi:MAG: four helix bundle protein [FCB group bacterium]|nr:four helix bundle protein [FCB group bacterium]
MDRNNLSERLFNFAVDILNYLPKLPKTTEFRVIRYQLAKSATSSGANYEESQAGSSKADFNNKVRIALREMRESNYWLRIIDKISGSNRDNIKPEPLIKESEELMNILGSIVTKTSKAH